jgi:hypothetical protein
VTVASMEQFLTYWRKAGSAGHPTGKLGTRGASRAPRWHLSPSKLAIVGRGEYTSSRMYDGVAVTVAVAWP